MKLEVIKGDITKLLVDAIVNAANSSLLGGGGVDGAIHRAGGHEILKECQKIRKTYGGCKAGHAVITTAGKLKAKKVIHTVGPIYTEGSSANAALKLKSCYIESLKLAQEHNLKTLAFPNISTGVYRYPKDEACTIAIKSVQSFKSDKIEKVIFVCFDDENYRLYTAIIN